MLATLSIILTPVNWVSKGKGTYFVYRTFARSVLIICGVKMDVDVRGSFDDNKKYLIISNHLSYLDIPILMCTVPRNIRFIYKKSITKVPIFGWAMYLGGYIPINRENARSAIESLKQAANMLTKDISIAIFPEGTRSRTGQIQEFKKGIFMLADFTQADIIPVSISGTSEILNPNSLKITPGKVKVVIDKPMPFVKDKAFPEDIKKVIVKNLI